jgi:HAD superfamily hydrolase (TIGR01490 family)
VDGVEGGRSDAVVAAFFDVDNTLLRGASIFHLARGLHRRGNVSTRDIVRAAWNHAYFRLVGVEDLAAVADARASALSFIAGHRVEEIESLSRDIFDESMASRIWPETRALAQMHLDLHQRVWLVTAAPIEIATIIADRLGLTGALGTVAEDVDGVYTGRLVGDLLHGRAKADAVLALAGSEGLDLTRCSAYSDSFNDLPMLSLVGNPFVINPDARLRQHAKARGWPLRDFRTGRRVAKVGVAATGGVAVLAGGVAGVQAMRRRTR